MSKEVAAALSKVGPRTGTLQRSNSSLSTSHETSASLSEDRLTLHDLPVEVLHRIIRFLPPKIVFSVLPLLSRGLNEIAQTAIPGCPRGDIVVECTLVLQHYSGTRGEVEPESVEQRAGRTIRLGRNAKWNSAFNFLSEFSAVRVQDSHSGWRDAWASCMSVVNVNLNTDLVSVTHSADLMPIVWRNLGSDAGRSGFLKERSVDLSIIGMVLHGILKLSDPHKKCWPTSPTIRWILRLFTSHRLLRRKPFQNSIRLWKQRENGRNGKMWKS
ncbi:hypothetical protein M427DRAFT_334586 [Gonapodya prolifera JEL478]|uniref:F-box domain-containing protein n=1 Tax=Gonapodya prolifera (strain JEL478) TaxID=1344416 RepID=A0A139ADX8_GONPJ|nr:hypothetical protein M427DRAFT_334586 [Gonapodya prolifera JEL478]|eukprot:KXS14794.1 hypothetical protein M427DRAFT_334586 [Gonapodya prolifera JEL478]